MNPTLVAFVRKELLQSLRDVRMRAVIFVLPVVQLTLFGLALSTEVRNIRLATDFSPLDVLSRRVAEACLATGWFVPAARGAGDPFHWVRAGGADAGMVSPRGGLARAVERGPATLQLLVDATNTIRARSIEVYFKTVLGGVLRETSPGPARASPVLLEPRVLYNPSMRTAVFLVPGVLSMILCVVTVILTSMSMAREKEMGTFETLVSAPLSNTEILLGKTLPYVLLGVADAVIVLTVAVFGFRVPMQGPVWQVLLAAVVFVFSTVAAGTLISTVARNQQQAMMGSFLFLFPAMLLSGIMFPLENMPRALGWIAYLNPLKYFVVLMRNIMLKGGDAWVVGGNLLELAALGMVLSWLAARRFHQTLN
ncbi:MAG TPA: ABC transporter permease [Elusimicrobiota bacterium]|nr:ABC transporter permease [Elusimicrobiota bacterium]